MPTQGTCPQVYSKKIWSYFSWRNINFKTRTCFGAFIEGNSSDTIQGYIYYFGVWEPNFTAFIKSRLSKSNERTFVDVGANIGYFSLLAAKIMPNGAIIALEAFPDIYSKLQKNIEHNRYQNIKTVPYAAAEGDCRIEMFHGGANNEGATTTIRDRFNVSPVTVQGKSLASLISESELQSMRLLKTDVEGVEYSAIKGMHSILHRLPDDVEIVVEIAPVSLGDQKRKDIFDIFENAGFLPYFLENSYSTEQYIKPNKVCRPIRLRLRFIPTNRSDVVFSKTDAEQL